MKFFKPVLVVTLLIALATISLSITPKKGKTGNRSNGKALSEEDKWVNDKLTKMTLEEKIGQSFMVACWSNRGDSHIEEIEQQITEDKIGGVIFFQEERFPYAQTIGAANDVELTKKMGEYMAIECDQMGIHLSFSPVADVNSNPKNPVIGFRAFGSDAAHVSKHVSAFVQGMEGQNVLSCVKHFPG